MKSWKTTLGAALTAFGGGLAVIDPAWAKAGALISLVGTTLGLFFAADHQSVQTAIEKNNGSGGKVISWLGLGALCLGLSGCATVTPEKRVARMATLAEVAAYTGSSVDLSAHPEHRLAYEAALTALDVLLASGTSDPLAFADALQGLPIKELRGETGAIVVNAAMILWTEYASDTINLDQTTYVKPVIVSVRRGLARTLGKEVAK